MTTPETISAETWQDRVQRLYRDMRGPRQVMTPMRLEEEARTLATASMLDDTQARLIRDGERLARIEGMLKPAEPLKSPAEQLAYQRLLDDPHTTQFSGAHPIAPPAWPAPSARDAVIEAARKVQWAYNAEYVTLFRGHLDKDDEVVKIFVSKKRWEALHATLAALDREGT